MHIFSRIFTLGGLCRDSAPLLSRKLSEPIHMLRVDVGSPRGPQLKLCPRYPHVVFLSMCLPHFLTESYWVLRGSISGGPSKASGLLQVSMRSHKVSLTLLSQSYSDSRGGDTDGGESPSCGKMNRHDGRYWCGHTVFLTFS